MFNTFIIFIIYTILLILSTCSAISDYKYRKIYNYYTYTAILSGLFINSIAFGWQGFYLSLIGLFTGIALVIVFYIFGVMGAGDVKLLGAMGCIGGAGFVFHVFIYSTFIGSIIAIFILFYKKESVLDSFKKLLYLLIHPFKSQEYEQLYIPYGVAISAACFIKIYQGII